jgi:CRISPR type IV-associated protein Csf1
MMIKYTGEIASASMRLDPIGAPHTGEDCACAMCQRPIVKGTPSLPKKFARTFCEFSQITESPFICGWCANLLSQDELRELQSCVITPHGRYSLGTDAARAWFWETPPPPPYVVVMNHSTTVVSNYVWRTPVTLDNRVVWANIDNTIHQIRRDRVINGLKHARRIVDVYNAERRKNLIQSPFARVSRSGVTSADGAGSHGRFSKEAYEALEETPDLLFSFDYLDSLRPGELIVLAPWLKKSPSVAIEPDLKYDTAQERQAVRDQKKAAKEAEKLAKSQA